MAGKARDKGPAGSKARPATSDSADDEIEVADGAELDTADEVDVAVEVDADIDDDDDDDDLLGDADDEDEVEVEAGVGAAAARAKVRKKLPSVQTTRMPESLTALNLYLARLKHVEILPIEEQAQLAVEFQTTGSKEAASRLVRSNLRLVVKIAFQFRRQWADVMDLIAEGNLGLAEAIRKFDAERGIPFPSYARFWIRARILAFIQENKHLIHAGSRAARKLFWRLERERRQLISEGLEPDHKLIAERVGVKEKDVRELAPILDQRPVSLDVPVHGDEDGRTRADVMADHDIASPEESATDMERQDILQRAFAEYRDTLDERDQAIWDKRLLSENPVRLEDLGEQFGVSKERVRQLEVRIKKRAKEYLQRKLGPDVIVEALA